MLGDHSSFIFVIIFFGVYTLCIQNFLSTFIHVPEYLGEPKAKLSFETVQHHKDQYDQQQQFKQLELQLSSLQEEKSQLQKSLMQKEIDYTSLEQSKIALSNALDSLEKQTLSNNINTEPKGFEHISHDIKERLIKYGYHGTADDWWKEYAQRYKDTVNGVIKPKLILYECGPSHGLGNKFPGITSAFVFALLTNRTYFLQWRDSTYDYGRAFTPPNGVEVDWNRVRSKFDLGRMTSTAVDWDARSENPGGVAALQALATEDFAVTYKDYDIINIKSNDYPLPVMALNPHYSQFFIENKGLFVFGDFGAKLMTVSSDIQQQVDEFKNNHFKKLTIGIQIRTKKHFKDVPKPAMETFFRLAKLVQAKHGVPDSETSFYVTSDESRAYTEAKNFFGKDNVYHTDFHPRRTLSGDLMAVVDMRLLSLCDEMVITHGSSFGQIAAAWTKKFPYSVAGGDTYWGAVASEPCYWNIRNALKVAEVREKQPPILALHHLICHPDKEVWGD